MKATISAITVFGAFLLLLGGCGRRVVYTSIPIEELEQRQPFLATVELVKIDDYRDKGYRHTNGNVGLMVDIGLKTETGERILIGGKPYSEDYMAEFAKSLQEGKTYEFPKTWLDYKASISTNR